MRCGVLFLLFGAVACAPASTPRQVSTSSPRAALAPEPPAPPTLASCYSGFSPTGEPRQDLERLTRACGPLEGMRAITEVHTSEQNERDPSDLYTFYVPAAGNCYRVYAASASGIEDLDLLLRDPAGRELHADLTHDSWPVLPPREALCLQQPGLYILEVSVYRGSGAYALQVWGG